LGDAVDLVVVTALREGQQLHLQVRQKRSAPRKPDTSGGKFALLNIKTANFVAVDFDGGDEEIAFLS
jgi:hypothetical protein